MKVKACSGDWWWLKNDEEEKIFAGFSLPVCSVFFVLLFILFICFNFHFRLIEFFFCFFFKIKHNCFLFCFTRWWWWNSLLSANYVFILFFLPTNQYILDGWMDISIIFFLWLKKWKFCCCCVFVCLFAVCFLFLFLLSTWSRLSSGNLEVFCRFVSFHFFCNKKNIDDDWISSAKCRCIEYCAVCVCQWYRCRIDQNQKREKTWLACILFVNNVFIFTTSHHITFI